MKPGYSNTRSWQINKLMLQLVHMAIDDLLSFGSSTHFYYWFYFKAGEREKERWMWRGVGSQSTYSTNNNSFERIAFICFRGVEKRSRGSVAGLCGGKSSSIVTANHLQPVDNQPPKGPVVFR